MQATLCLDTLGDLDGGAARAIIDAAIRDAVRDLDDRGEDEKPRFVEVRLSLSRMDNGLLACHVEAAAKTPRRRTASTVGQVARRGGDVGVLFQTYAPEDPHQRTIDEVEHNNRNLGVDE